MSDDAKIELLKRRKLQELKRRLFVEKLEAEKKESTTEQARGFPSSPQAKNLLQQVFVGRAWEVWNAAEDQYPKVTKELEKALVSFITAGRLRGHITGEQLFWFFRRLGVRVRLNTKIRIYESGELKSIADKLRQQ
jgi:DNA-binding TFAR19-related protein (PDSD5 family)